MVATIMQVPHVPAGAAAVSSRAVRHAQPFARWKRASWKPARYGQPARLSAESSSSEEPQPRTLTAAAAASAAAEAAPVDQDPPGGEAPASHQAAYEAALEAADGDDSRAFAVAMAREAWDTKAEDTLVLHVAPLIYWTRYMVIATVFSKPQLNALLAKMTKQAEEVFDRQLTHSVEGRSAWELLDYGDVVIHVMTAEQREFYDLETFYATAEEVDLPFTRGGSPPDAAWQKRLA